MERINKTRVAQTFLSAFLLFIAPALFASDRYEHPIHAALTWKGGRVTIDHRFGRLELHTTSGNEVNVRGTVRSSDPEFGKQIHFNVSESGGGITIRTDVPSVHWEGNLSYSVDIDVSVPANAPLSVRNRFGSINASGVHAPSEFTNAQGSMQLTDLRGAQHIENSFGSVSVTNSAGDTVIRNANGSVTVSHVGGSLDVSDRFGSVRVDDVDRALALKNENGSVDVRDVGGNATISNSFATSTVSNVRGALDLTSTNGNVVVTEAGRTSIRTSFGSVRATTIRGDAEVHDSNGNITLSGVEGAAKVRTTFGSVFLKGIAGTISVENQNGAISVSDLPSGKCREMSLKTNFSSIRVDLPHAGYNVHARTSFGSIHSDLPITASGSLSQENLTGTINGGGCRLELETANGNITIE
jgi:DUF4097 and DUF4098 domain-containing protein YvlB